jgi:hypothetical protein
MNNQDYLWSGFAKALGFEPREETTLSGLSGQMHQFTGLALDEIGKRVLVFSSELDPRMAAMVHADANANLSDYKLLTVRPITFDMQQLALFIEAATGTLEFEQESAMKSLQVWTDANPPPIITGATLAEGLSLLKVFLGTAGNVVMPFLRAATLSGLSPSEQFILLVRELTLLDWSTILKSEGEKQRINLCPLARHDSQKWDREYGLCPFPLYELKEDDWEIFKSGSNKEAIRSCLLDMGVAQYFNPPKDHAALAVIDRGIQKQLAVAEAILKLPEIGHPIAENEFLGNSQDLVSTIQQLSGLGYVAEGDLGLAVTDAGKEFRATVRFKPRESVFSKLLNRISVGVAISPKDLM